MTADILTEIRGRVGIVTLNAPERRNAIRPSMDTALREAVLAFDADDELGAIVITGNGPAFCGGIDVRGWDRDLSDGTEGLARQKQTVATYTNWTELWPSVKPTVAALNGAAIGAGLGLILATDWRIAADNAVVSARFARMGLSAENTQLMVDLIGLSRAMDLMISGDTLSAAESLKAGLVNEIVPPDELLGQAVAKAAHYAEVHPDVTRATKGLVWANLHEPDRAVGHQRQREVLERTRALPAHQEAVTAFIEKRKPDPYAAVADAKRIQQ